MLVSILKCLLVIEAGGTQIFMLRSSEVQHHNITYNTV
jgi:hypothetical protein